jgi:uracil-DNA glycosylase
MWNLVPWDIGTETKVRPTARAHHTVGVNALLELLPLLRLLKTIVFFGAKAQVAMPAVVEARPDLLLLPCPHPSPTNLNTRPEARRTILEALERAALTADDA